MQETFRTLFETNQTTQPVQINSKCFNNWEFVPKGWVVIAESKELKKKKIISKTIYGHRLAVYRTANGKAHAIDSFCPHMGMDMVKGKVVGERIQCMFHHWEFDEKGDCVKIPCLDKVPNLKKVNAQAYPVEEKYGLIWVYTDKEAPYPVYEVPSLKGKDIVFTHLKPFVRIAHPHVTMMNSIDEQHMRTVHLLEIDLELETKEEGSQFTVDFEGKVVKSNLLGKIQNFLLGDKWKSQVQLIDGCLGILNIMLNSKLLNKIPLPSGHYLFSQPFVEEGKTYVWPIIVTEKRKGPIGYLFSKSLVTFHKILMWFLAYQDGRVIYGHLRFSASGLIPGVDETTSKWISFVNRNLKPSIWSKNS